MKLALIASYDKLIQGLEMASHPGNQVKLSQVGWNGTTDLEKVLKDIQAAEQDVFVATHALSELISKAGHLLVTLDNACGMAAVAGVSAAAESSFRYSTSMSSSSSLPWQYNSGSVWVTTYPPGSSLGDPAALAGQSPTKYFAGTAEDGTPGKKAET